MGDNSGEKPMKIRITEQKHGSLTEAERLEIARLLVKAGYSVRIGKERPSEKANFKWFIEYLETNERSAS